MYRNIFVDQFVVTTDKESGNSLKGFLGHFVVFLLNYIWRL